jgi:hypothetical protein
MRRPPVTRLLGAILASALTVPGCAPLRVLTTPMEYALARTDAGTRGNFDRGLAQLKAEAHQPALDSFNRALWDLERIEKDSLRLKELAAVHQALGDTYSGLRRTDWAAEHRALAIALATYRQTRPAATVP